MLNDIEYNESIGRIDILLEETQLRIREGFHMIELLESRQDDINDLGRSLLLVEIAWFENHAMAVAELGFKSTKQDEDKKEDLYHQLYLIDEKMCEILRCAVSFHTQENYLMDYLCTLLKLKLSTRGSVMESPHMAK